MTLPKGYDRDKANSKDYNHKNTSSDNKDNSSEVDEKKWFVDRIERALNTMTKAVESERATLKSDAELELKKWRIDRNQKVYEVLVQGLESIRTELKSELELVGNTITTWRNPVLAGVSFAAPIILAMTSLASVIGLPQDFLLKLLIVDVVIGLAAFIVFTLIKGKVNGHILSVDTAFQIAKRKVNTLNSSFIGDTRYIDKTSNNLEHAYLTYTAFLLIIMNYDWIPSIEKILDSYFFRNIKSKNDFRDYVDNFNKLKNDAVEMFEELKEEWKEDGLDLKILSNVHGDFLRSNGYKRIEETGEWYKPIDEGQTRKVL